MAGKKKALLISAATAFAGAFVPTLVVVKAMVDHNAQGEAYDPVTGEWDVDYVLTFASLWYVPCFLLIFSVTFCILWLARAEEF